MTDNILIIERNPTLREELTSVLRKAGFEVVNVPDYPEGLPKLDEFKPDIAILDQVLVDGDGGGACYQLLRAIGVPIILLGNDSSAEGWAKAVEVDADLSLKKPFSYLELVARVKAILRRYKGTTPAGKGTR